MLSPRKLAVPTDAELERCAFNAAFHELGLRWHWDPPTYEQLSAVVSEDGARVQRYLEQAQPHLLRAYDAQELSDVIVEAKRRLERMFAQSGPHGQMALSQVDWAETQAGQIGY